jgi:glyoxylase-like metal-dependent hydrolase (beta-lactamase superfamily II)
VILTYLLPHKEGYLLIETGPESTSSHLLSVLPSYLGGRPLTHILVTHIHLDHAGGAGTLSKAFSAEVLVHPLGEPHLKEPSRLLASARKLYGDALEPLFGIPEKVEKVRSLSDGEVLSLPGRELKIFHTPGHARHHLVVWDPEEEILFGGDLLGIRFGPVETLLPPTPPPEFDLELWLESLEKIEKVPWGSFALTHGGIFTDRKDHLSVLKDRLVQMVDWVKSRKGGTLDRLISSWFENFSEFIPPSETIMPFSGVEGGIALYLKKKEGKRVQG